MQQFWHTIKKIQGTNSYEFILANKKCVVNADVFRTILDICLRVEGVDFTDVLDDDTALAFLIELVYKGPLYKHTNVFVDHMHQPLRTLAAIINKENVDYPKLIWEDLAYQIDHRKEKKSRYDGIVCMLKFVKIGEDYQEYRLRILDTMLTEEIKRLESYHMFYKYSTGQIPPKKSRGKGSQGKKTSDAPVEEVEVSEESEPEPVNKKTSSNKRVKKTVTIFAKDNIKPDPDIALELGKSIRLTEAEEVEAARKVHATHARIVTKFVPTPARRRSSDTSHKLKGV
ncbi:hypothetical protein Tco_0404621 [Tanacetum coccineum]